MSRGSQQGSGRRHDRDWETGERHEDRHASEDWRGRNEDLGAYEPRSRYSEQDDRFGDQQNERWRTGEESRDYQQGRGGRNYGQSQQPWQQSGDFRGRGGQFEDPWHTGGQFQEQRGRFGHGGSSQSGPDQSQLHGSRGGYAQGGSFGGGGYAEQFGPMRSGMSGGMQDDYRRQQWMSGPHSGKGPKGYKRSDERIREELADNLTRHPGIDASEIEINVREGTVTLKGTVGDRHVKYLLEEAADDVSGVREVDNQVRVHRGNGGSQQIESSSTGATAGTGSTKQQQQQGRQQAERQ